MKYLIFIALCSMTTTLWATVGGGESLSVMGYEPKEQKIYVLRDYEDGRGRVPQLYYFDLKGKNPYKLIEVKSLYRHPKTQKLEYISIEDKGYAQFKQHLNNIQQRLMPLTPLKPNSIQLKINRLTSKQIIAWYDRYDDSKPLAQKDKIPQYQYRYTLHSQQPKLQSLAQTATSYKKDLHIRHVYAVPQQSYRIAIVRYLGIDFETGYHVDDAILLAPTQPATSSKK